MCEIWKCATWVQSLLQKTVNIMCDVLPWIGLQLFGDINCNIVNRIVFDEPICVYRGFSEAYLINILVVIPVLEKILEYKKVSYSFFVNSLGIIVLK